MLHKALIPMGKLSLAQSLLIPAHSTVQRIDMSLAKAFLAITFAASSFGAQASLVKPDEFKTNTLTWLKLSETAGLSMSEFSSGVGGWNASYRLAQSHEIEQLLGILGVAEGDTGWRPGAPGAGSFVFNLGGTAPGDVPYAGTWGFDGNQGANGVGLGWSVTAYLNNGYHPMPISADCPAYTNCARIIATEGYGSPLGGGDAATGLFLVRIPEPGTLALLSLAGGLLAYQRRRKRIK